MTGQIVELVLDESKWLFASMLFAAILVVVLVARQAGERRSRRRLVLWAMNMFYGCLIGTMALGHLVAVTIKASQGTLSGSAWPLYLLGLGLAIPSWWLVSRAGRSPKDDGLGRTGAPVLNIWLGLSLLALGLHNWVLAAPAGLNVAYQYHTRRRVGWLIMAVATVGYLGLFIGSLVFLASGQSFEQFSGLE